MDNQGWGTREGPKLPAAVDEAKVIKDKLHLDFTILIVSMTLSEEIFCFKFYLPVDSNGTARQRQGVGNQQVDENTGQQQTGASARGRGQRGDHQHPDGRPHQRHPDGGRAQGEGETEDAQGFDAR